MFLITGTKKNINE